MLSESGNPSMDNLAAIFGAVRKRLGVDIEVHAVARQSRGVGVFLAFASRSASRCRNHLLVGQISPSVHQEYAAGPARHGAKRANRHTTMRQSMKPHMDEAKA